MDTLPQELVQVLFSVSLGMAGGYFLAKFDAGGVALVALMRDGLVPGSHSPSPLAPTLEDEIEELYFVRSADPTVGFDALHPPNAVIFIDREYRRREGGHYYSEGGRFVKEYKTVETQWLEAHNAWEARQSQKQRAAAAWR